MKVKTPSPASSIHRRKPLHPSVESRDAPTTGNNQPATPNHSIDLYRLQTEPSSISHRNALLTHWQQVSGNACVQRLLHKNQGLFRQDDLPPMPGTATGWHGIDPGEVVRWAALGLSFLRNEQELRKAEQAVQDRAAEMEEMLNNNPGWGVMIELILKSTAPRNIPQEARDLRTWYFVTVNIESFPERETALETMRAQNYYGQPEFEYVSRYHWIYPPPHLLSQAAEQGQL